MFSSHSLTDGHVHSIRKPLLQPFSGRAQALLQKKLIV